VRAFLIAMASTLALSGCAAHGSAYTRTDGVPVDPLHQQATLAQCKGEGLLELGEANLAPSLGRLLKRGRKVRSSMPAWRGMVTFKRSSEQPRS